MANLANGRLASFAGKRFTRSVTKQALQILNGNDEIQGEEGDCLLGVLKKEFFLDMGMEMTVVEKYHSRKKKTFLGESGRKKRTVTLRGTLADFRNEGVDQGLLNEGE